MSPKDALIDDHDRFELEDAKAAARKANTISTVDEAVKEELFSSQEKFQLRVNNQKLGLVRALLKIGNWDDAKHLMTLMPPQYCLSMDDRVRRNLSRLISIGIDDIYRSNSGLPTLIANRIKPMETKSVKYFKSASSFQEFVDDVYPLIQFIGPFIFSDTLLMTKLIRIFNVVIKREKSSKEKKNLESGEQDIAVDNDNSIDSFVCEKDYELTPQLKACIINILDEVILPGISLTESNCGLAEELWSLLRLFPFETRYRLYHGWKKTPTNALMMKKRASDLKKIKYVMKRLSKENVKPTGRQIGKLSHSNPSFLFETVSNGFVSPSGVDEDLSSTSTIDSTSLDDAYTGHCSLYSFPRSCLRSKPTTTSSYQSLTRLST